MSIRLVCLYKLCYGFIFNCETSDFYLTTKYERIKYIEFGTEIEGIFDNLCPKKRNTCTETETSVYICMHMKYTYNGRTGKKNV